ncbi:MAG: PAS domain S-box protein [Steroidobacteraceae bacterium]|jgi:PAS domain S-box-containing protein|nr:PAS domain S-box protein [Steroidobacteraceae bacterium]
MTDSIDRWPCGLLSLDPGGRIVAVNRSLGDGLGYLAEELLGQSIDRLLPAGSRIFFHAHLQPLLAVKGQVAEVYLPLKTRHGETLPMLVNATSVAEGEGHRSDCAFFPTTMRARYEERLLAAKCEAESERSRNAALAERIAVMREQLRQSLAHTLHESLAQEIGSLKWRLEALHAGAAAAGTESANELAELARTAGATLERVRRLSYELHPLELQQLGLRAATQRCARALAAGTGVAVEVVGGDPLPAARDAASLVLFRVVEEALRNALGHARASRVTVEIGHDAGTIMATVRDDGIGMCAGTPDEPGSLGLLEIRQRLASVGGALALRTAPGRGCTLEARIPRAVPEPGVAAGPGRASVSSTG